MVWPFCSAGICLRPIQYWVRYFEGVVVTRDYVKAHKWFNLSFINGHEAGCRHLEACERPMTRFPKLGDYHMSGKKSI
jgi:hypothetical protein